ncbi:interferon-induced protein with tetratricopeptide repeats 2-like [Ptychodera flava]|uniref:interferon-induced protein with tetratricopeptide repeats 2-like n=1 Tax=Ptychodera flava TaxID=63121 RepID=UPI003969EA94
MATACESELFWIEKPRGTLIEWCIGSGIKSVTAMATQTKVSLGQVTKVVGAFKQTTQSGQVYRDVLIEEFSFQFELVRDGRNSSYEAILKTLPCYFNWDLEESTDEDFKVMVRCAEENLVSNTELSLVAHKTMLGYLCMTGLRRKDDKDPAAALSWFDDALSDNRLDMESCSDSDGPLGDRLILLGNIAWVYFITGRMDMVHKTLQNIKQISDGKLSDSTKAFIYGHKGISLAYFLKEACWLGLACFELALSIFPNHTDWLFWSGNMLDIHRMRIYGASRTPEALSVLDRTEIIYKHIIEIYSGHNYAITMLDRNYLDRGKFDKAEPFSTCASECNTTLPTVACIASSVYAAAKKFELSLETLEKALKLWPKNTYLLHFMANVYKSKHDYESARVPNQTNLKKAIQYYEKASTYSKENAPWITLDKAKAYAISGNLAESHRLFFLVASTARDPFWRSVAYLEFGEFCMHHLREPSNAMKYYKMATEEGTEYWAGKRAASLLGAKM